MPIAIHPFPMADATNQSQQPRLPLRRAVYVHVSDLTNAYNIDHPKLEQELARVKVGDEENASPEEREIDSSSGDGESVSSIPQPPRQRRNLHAPRAGFNLCVLVGTVKVVVDKLRVDRSRVRLAEVEVGDETGVVSLRARDDQIEALREVSERSGAVVLRNCSVELFQGKHIRLAVTKWGKLTPYPDQIASTPPPPPKMNRDRNFSLIDMSLVASELVQMSPSEAPFSPQSQYRQLENVGSGGQGARQQPSRQQQYQQNMQMSRKAPARDRRQQRPKTGGMNPSHGMRYPAETGIPGHLAPIPYSGMPGFSSPFPEQGMDVPQFPSQGGRGHAHQASTQHLLMQQYEMHQRQLQQMQAYHEQQERNRPMMQRHSQHGHQMQGSPMLVPNASFETTGTGDYNVPSPVSGPASHQSMHLVGTNPMLLHVSMPGGQPSQAEHYGSLPSVMSVQGTPQPSVSIGHSEAFRPYRDPSVHGETEVTPPSGGDSEGAAAVEAWGTSATSSFVSKDDSSLSPGQMNPQATAFAPSLHKDSSGEQQQMQSSAYGYFAYDPSGMYSPQPPPPPVYGQNVMYMPMTAGGTTTERSPEDRDVAASPSDSHQSKTREPEAGTSPHQD